MIRPPIPSDQGYIASTWARSLLSAMRGSRHLLPDGQQRSAFDWSGHAARRHGPERVFLPRKNERDMRKEIGERINLVLDRPDTRALVSEIERGSKPELILGWVIYVEGPSVPVVHYLYTRNADENGAPLRGHGIARALLRHIGVTTRGAVVCTSDGPSSEEMRGHFPASVHVPLAEFLGQRQEKR